MKNTTISFLYRDASNYKFWYEETVQGAMTDDQIKAILATLDEGEYFIPLAVGFRCNYAENCEPCEDDHPWCELGEGSFELTNKEPTLQDVTCESLVLAFQNASKNWAHYAEEAMVKFGMSA